MIRKYSAKLEEKVVIDTAHNLFSRFWRLALATFDSLVS
jgi:hypothetical protein